MFKRGILFSILFLFKEIAEKSRNLVFYSMNRMPINLTEKKFFLTLSSVSEYRNRKMM